MIIINCPNCNQCIEVIKLNCKIFRCGVFKENMKQIDPHLCKNKCEQLVLENKIYGCGKPFQVEVVEKIDNVNSEIEYKAVICGYI